MAKKREIVLNQLHRLCRSLGVKSYFLTGSHLRVVPAPGMVLNVYRDDFDLNYWAVYAVRGNFETKKKIEWLFQCNTGAELFIKMKNNRCFSKLIFDEVLA